MKWKGLSKGDYDSHATLALVDTTSKIQLRPQPGQATFSISNPLKIILFYFENT